MLNTRIFKYIEGDHYNHNHISSPMTSDATIRIRLISMIVIEWTNYLAVVNRVFFVDSFENGQKSYLKFRKGSKVSLEEMNEVHYFISIVIYTMARLFITKIVESKSKEGCEILQTKEIDVLPRVNISYFISKVDNRRYNFVYEMLIFSTFVSLD